MGGVPAATRRSSSPQRESWRTPARISPCVDTVSTPRPARSTTATLTPARASRRAVDAPATRPPTTTTSKVLTSGSPRCCSEERSGGEEQRGVNSCQGLLDRPAVGPFAEQVPDDVACVVTGAVDQVGVASVLEALAHGVDARGSGDAAVLADAAVRSRDGQPQPGVVRPEAGGDDDGADALGPQVEPPRLWIDAHRSRPDPGPHLAGEPGA